MTTLDHLKLLPRPHHLAALAGDPWRPAGELRWSLSPGAAPLGDIVVAEAAATGLALTPPTLAGDGFRFAIGTAPPTTVEPAPPGGAEAYALRIGPGGVLAVARDYRGLVYAWQTLKQILRADAATVPALTIADRPALPWRIYHLDLKGTRWNRRRLDSLLSLAAELKLNALLVEYEDYLRLDRHPDLAIPEALSPAEWRAWIARAAAHGLAIIPLVQTLGHWQYVLRHPAYAHLQEKAGDTGEGCSSHPGSWELARDFMDEIMALHPGAPFIHVGLDETFNIGTCPRCVERLAGRPRLTLFLEWVTRVTAHVRAQGFTPMVWGDMVVNELSEEVERALGRDQVLVDWAYHTTGYGCPTVHFQGNRLSRQWLRRPEGNPCTEPAVPFGGKGRFWEDLPEPIRQRLAPYAGHPEQPRQFYSHPALPLLRQRGHRVMGAAAARSSNHGTVYPLFMQGQMNNLEWARSAITHGGEGVIATSWGRGHSFTCANAHPEMDWYAVATLGAAGWGTLTEHELRDFDERFAWQFLGLPDGHLGDLLYLLGRTAQRVDHTMTSYLEYVADELPPMIAAATRNRHWLELLADLVGAQRLRQRGQFGLLEIEYFYPVWDGVPPAFRERIGRDLRQVVADMEERRPALTARYAETLLARDAAEMVATQFDFIRDGVAMFHHKCYGHG